jgi:hypothetical protein
VTFALQSQLLLSLQVGDVDPDADDERLDAALVLATNDPEVAVLAQVLAPRVGARLNNTVITMASLTHA